MKEKNKPEEVPVIEEPKKQEQPKVEEPKVEKKEPKERPYIGYKKEKLQELLEKWRDMFNEAVTPADKDYTRNKVQELERELKRR